MSLELPRPLAVLFAAQNGQNTQALAQRFAKAIVVRDDGRTVVGPATIEDGGRKPNGNAGRESEPIASAGKDGETTVTGRVTGFPGSPVDLQFMFGVEAGRIASLKVL